MVETSGDLNPLRSAMATLAELDLLEGRPDAALARLVPLLDRPVMEELGVTPLLPLLAWAHVEMGDAARAEAVVAWSIARAAAQHDRITLVEALRVRAMAHTHLARWSEAERALEEGLSVARGMPYPYAEARLLQVYGLMHLRQGAVRPARARLGAAIALFRQLGAREDVERTEQLLATRS